jgi:23S rRNA pseudouridine2605 synthase
MNEGIRLNKALSMLGICSRRDGDKKISNGEVSVNGEVVTDMGKRVGTDDTISICGTVHTLGAVPKQRIWIYNKPRGLVTSHRDEIGRPTVFDSLKTRIHERVISVGRLDLDSEGLMLVTNNSQFARAAEMSTWERHYDVRIFGTLTDEQKHDLESGIELDGIRYKPVIIRQISSMCGGGRNSWIRCIIREGKNREIRKILGHFGIMVSRLIRCRYGPYELGDLPLGEIREICNCHLTKD